MNKIDCIKFVQKCAEDNNIQAYPTQDYYLRPSINQYGAPSSIPFPKGIGIGCAFDTNGNLIYVFIHSSWSNHFSGPKIDDLESKWDNIPVFIVSFILQGVCAGYLSKLAKKIKNGLIKECKNQFRKP